VTRTAKPTLSPPLSRSRATPRVAKLGDAALLSISGLIDEQFPGFGDLSEVQTLVVDLAGVSSITSFGVRQWLRSMAAVPPTVARMYLVNCPVIIVDQLNMILGFGGRAQVVSLAAPFVCGKCGNYAKETVDATAEGDYIARGELAPRTCQKCGGTLELDEIVESYFACLKKYGVATLDPIAGQLLAAAPGLKSAAITKSLEPATTDPSETASAALRTADAAGAGGGRSIFVVALVTVLALIGAGVYVLVGPR
jgi:hypothetical protein